MHKGPIQQTSGCNVVVTEWLTKRFASLKPCTVQCIVRSPHWQYFTRVYIIHVSTDATVNPIFAVRSSEISCQTETEFNLD